MISIPQKLTPDLVTAAQGFAELRNNCKEYLSQFDLNFDKFTVVSHDSFIGYITEYVLLEYISGKYGAVGVTVKAWESNFDIAKIRFILKTNSPAESDVSVVQAHKPGKDHMVLSYYVVDDTKNIESLKKIVIVGYTSEQVIRSCRMIKAGTRTKFGTVSQIDNYETELSVHYKGIDGLVALLK